MDRNKLIAVLVMFGGLMQAQQAAPSSKPRRFVEYTVATLPAASTVTGQTFIVTDAATAGSCSSGSGSSVSWCRSNGSSYDAVGDGGSGGIGITIIDQTTGATTITPSAGTDVAGDTYTLTAAQMAQNKNITGMAAGSASSAASSPGTLTIKIKIGSVAVCAFAATSMNTSKSNVNWEIDYNIWFPNAAGASVAVYSQCTFKSNGLFTVNLVQPTTFGSVAAVTTNSNQTAGPYFNYSATTSPNGASQTMSYVWEN